MGQPITVLEKQSSNPAILRFETNRPLSGMGHESYDEPPSELLDHPVHELARRLFAAGGVERVHINGSVITVTLGRGRTGAGLADVVRGLFLHYGEATPATGVTPPTDDADVAPEMAADPGETPAAQAADEPAAAAPAAADVGAAEHAVAVEDGGGDVPTEARPEAAPIEGVPDSELVPGTPAEGVGTEHEPTEGPIAEEPTEPTA